MSDRMQAQRLTALVIFVVLAAGAARAQPAAVDSAALTEAKCTSPALAATVTTATAAIYFHLPLGFYVESGGVEFAGLWAILLLYIGTRGGGAISVDRLIGREF